MRPPLKYEVHQGGLPTYYRLYECEHITDGTFANNALEVIPIGEHTNLLLCKHCWQHIKGLVVEELFKRTLQRASQAQVVELIRLMGEDDDE